MKSQSIGFEGDASIKALPNKIEIKSRRSLMPSSKEITNHWQKYLSEYFDTDFIDGVCFACGRNGKTERSHIVPLQFGGANNAGNLHNLCSGCHTESEIYIDVDAYWIWFNSKDKSSGIEQQFSVIHEMINQAKLTLLSKGIEPTENALRNYLSGVLKLNL